MTDIRGHGNIRRLGVGSWWAEGTRPWAKGQNDRPFGAMWEKTALRNGGIVVTK